MTPQIAALMAEYNGWMNERMYAAAAKLPGEALVADRGAFFGSILGTLNHIAAGDAIWLHRLAAHRSSAATLASLAEFPRPAALREPMAQDFAGLTACRQRLDAFILGWVAELTPEHMASDLRYTSTAGVVSTRNFGALLQHFFNHQTHHRGQVSTLLFQAGVDVGVTDLVALIPTRVDSPGSLPQESP
jgi:uncharacterized damage-inducible protein DinB